MIQEPAMSEPKARVWKKIVCFYTLTMLFSSVCGAFVLHAGKMDAGHLLYVTGAMWSPGLAAFATKKLFKESIRDLQWGWGNARYAWLGYLIPIGYALPVYLITWITGLGGFNMSILPKVAADFGWQNFSPSLTLVLFVLVTATLGMVGKLSRALGEEIGWRGFLVPELAKVVGFPGIGLISGLMWAFYHFPVLLFANYNAGAPAWYSATCFTISVVSDSFIMAWLTLRARSLWPAAILHASHNLFIQSILTPLEFARRSRKLYPEREAVVDGDLRLSYEQFFERCDAWSAVLQALGVKQGDRVAYIAPNTHAQLESFYAVPQIGAVLVPLNYRLTADDFAYLIQHSGARVVCADIDYLGRIDSIRSKIPDVSAFVRSAEASQGGWIMRH